MLATRLSSCEYLDFTEFGRGRSQLQGKLTMGRNGCGGGHDSIFACGHFVKNLQAKHFQMFFLENHHVTQVNIFVKLEVSDDIVFENKTLLFLTRVSRRESSASTPVSWNCLSRLYNSLTENQKFEELCSNLSEFTKTGSTEQFVANRWAYTSKRSVLCEISSQLARVNAEIAVRSVRISS